MASGRGYSVECIAWRATLQFVPNSYPLVFRCGRGHYQTLRDIFDELLLHRKAPSLSTVECWEERRQFLRRLAAEALRDGYVFTAADFQEAATWVEDWTGKLRQLLSC